MNIRKFRVFTPVAVNINVTNPKPTCFEERIGEQQTREIASSQVDGYSMRLSAFRDSDNPKYIWWQLEDAEGNKLAGVLPDLEAAIEQIKGQL